MIRVVHPASCIRILIFYPSRIQGSKRHRIPDLDPQHWEKVPDNVWKTCEESMRRVAAAAGVHSRNLSFKEVVTEKQIFYRAF